MLISMMNLFNEHRAKNGNHRTCKNLYLWGKKHCFLSTSSYTIPQRNPITAWGSISYSVYTMNQINCLPRVGHWFVFYGEKAEIHFKFDLANFFFMRVTKAIGWSYFYMRSFFKRFNWSEEITSRDCVRSSALVLKWVSYYFFCNYYRRIFKK